MDTRIKAIICAVPFLLAFGIWFGLISPVFSEGQDRDSQVDQKRKEEIELKAKLFELTKLQKEKVTLSKEIDLLRGSVPKEANLDVLLIDVEKMALASNMDVVAVEKPDAERLKKMSSSDLAPPEEADLKDAKKAATGGKPAKDAKTPKKVKEAPIETGLNKLSVDVSVTGDYVSFIELMKKLESYERVIGVNQIEVELPLPKDSKSKEAVDMSETLEISFLMTAYYLP